MEWWSGGVSVEEGGVTAARPLREDMNSSTIQCIPTIHTSTTIQYNTIQYTTRSIQGSRYRQKDHHP